MTADVDVTVEVPADEIHPLLTAMKRAGFAARVDDIEEFARRTRVLPLVHRPTGIPLDLVIAGDGLEESFLDRAKQIDLGGFDASIIAIEDLVVAKIIAGRPKDLEDVRGLLLVGREIDHGAIVDALAPSVPTSLRQSPDPKFLYLSSL